MTTIATTCAGCGRQLAVPERYQGRDLKCPGCGHSFRVEAPAPASARPAQPTPPAPPRSMAPEPPPALHEPLAPFGDLFTAPEDDERAPSDEAPAADEVETGPVYWRLQRLGVLSLGLVSGVLYAALGLLIGIGVVVASLFLPGPALPFVRGRLAGGLAIIVLPVLYGAAGFALGALTALLYNVAARVIGGVRVLLE
jgi:hypothetical protein